MSAGETTRPVGNGLFEEAWARREKLIDAIAAGTCSDEDLECLRVNISNFDPWVIDVIDRLGKREDGKGADLIPGVLTLMAVATGMDNIKLERQSLQHIQPGNGAALEAVPPLPEQALDLQPEQAPETNPEWREGRVVRLHIATPSPEGAA
jgi:hypothetical protein